MILTLALWGSANWIIAYWVGYRQGQRAEQKSAWGRVVQTFSDRARAEEEHGR